MNQYRCETCYNAKCIWNHENPHAYSGCFQHRNLTFASYWANNFMEKVGCASHSDFQNQRDKVLDEVLQLPQRREQPNGSMYIYVDDVKELRQVGE